MVTAQRTAAAPYPQAVTPCADRKDHAATGPRGHPRGLGSARPPLTRAGGAGLPPPHLPARPAGGGVGGTEPAGGASEGWRAGSAALTMEGGEGGAAAANCLRGAHGGAGAAAAI